MRTKLHAKQIHDKRFKTSANKNLQIGTKVLVKQDKINKLSASFKNHPFTITDIKGTMVTPKSDINNQETTRNISHSKLIPEQLKLPNNEENEEEEEDYLVEPEIVEEEQIQPEPIHIQTNQQRLNVLPRKTYPQRYRLPMELWQK
mgnify:CR=1 FL=1